MVTEPICWIIKSDTNYDRIAFPSSHKLRTFICLSKHSPDEVLIYGCRLTWAESSWGTFPTRRNSQWLPRYQNSYFVSTRASRPRVMLSTFIKRTWLNVNKDEWCQQKSIDPIPEISQCNSPTHDLHQNVFVISSTTLTAAWKYTFIRGYRVLCTCQHLSRAGAGRSTVHHFMTMITSTYLLLRWDRLTCMPRHSAANYFLIQASCCVLRLWHIQQQCLKIIFLRQKKKKKKGFRIKVTQSHVHFLFFSRFIIGPNFLVATRFTQKIKPQSLNHPFSSYAKLWLRNLSETSHNL